MIANDPTVLSEVTDAVDAYEAALMANDVEALDGAFWNSPHTVRLGVAENLYGFAAIAAFRPGLADRDGMGDDGAPVAGDPGQVGPGGDAV